MPKTRQSNPVAAAGIVPAAVTGNPARKSVIRDAFVALEFETTYTVPAGRIQRLRQIAKALDCKIKTTADPYIAGNTIFTKHKL